ncbi:glycosyltransferase [Vibrio sp. 1CM2L]|uniref:glycosyltransferase n=1 Tax=Vibrio sp. 1CM2L TaxID=2929166 RepID=UPI0020BE7D0D|nr:glycosyltransferase [Vibrio sp. 1CM2L]MCK8078691.1 glycosyltransferase [Vibrio sp. 1CM2L]
MKASILMPCYNAEKYIARAITSLLNQTYAEFEIVIVDDGSTDSTKEVILSFKDSRIKMIELCKNQGITNALNVGLSECKGQFIARMDADDFSFPNRIERQLDFFEKNENVIAVGSSIVNFDEFGNEVLVKYPSTHDEIKANLYMYERSICHPSVMIRSEIVKKIKYSNKYPYCEDMKLWFDLIKLGQVANIDEALIKYYRHSLQVSNNFNLEQMEATKNLLTEMFEDYKISEIEVFIKYIQCNVRMRSKDRIELLNIIPILCKSLDVSEYSIKSSLYLKDLKYLNRFNGSYLAMIKSLFRFLFFSKYDILNRIKLIANLVNFSRKYNEV